MEVSEGIDYLLCILRDKNIRDFNSINTDMFNHFPEEKRFYNFISKFYTRRSTFPTSEACAKYNFKTYDVLEPISFYYEQLYERFVLYKTKAFIKGFDDINETLKSMILGDSDPKELELYIKQFCTDQLLSFKNNKDDIVVNTFEEETDRFIKQQNLNIFNKGNLGILTPYDKINESSKGLKTSEWCLITGNAKMGKSFLWVYFIYYAWLRSGNPTLIGSLEMDSLDEYATTGIYARLISIISGINLSMIRDGKLATPALDVVKKSIKRYNDYYVFENKTMPPLYFLNGRKNKSLSSFKKAIDYFNPLVVGIDSVYLADPIENKFYKDRYEKEARVADDRMEMIQSTRTIGIDTHQLTKTAIKEKDLDIDNIAGVAGWVRNPDLVIALQPYEKDKEIDRSKRYITKLAGRNLEKDFKFPINFKFKPSFDMTEVITQDIDFNTTNDEDDKLFK